MPRCGGMLEAEAVIAGRTVRVAKHSTVIEFYGSVEEAEALIARARVSLESRGHNDVAARLKELQKAVRLLPALLGGFVGLEELLEKTRRAVEGLPKPEGWSLTGCTPEDPDIMLAAARLRAAERSLSRAVEEELVPLDLAYKISAAIGELTVALYTIHWVLCLESGGYVARTTAELARA